MDFTISITQEVGLDSKVPKIEPIVQESGSVFQITTFFAFLTSAIPREQICSVIVRLLSKAFRE